tara:strand:- start:1157 stop:2248 length:1092 start_codon:yes stop_codon:yes gene_type:complete
MKLRNFLILPLILAISLALTWTQSLEAALPPGNAVKDPYAILRNALPIEQKELRGLQNKLEETSDLVRGNRWPAVNKAATSSQFLLSKNKNKILDSIPPKKRVEAENIMTLLKDNLNKLGEFSSSKDKINFIEERRESLQKIGELEGLLLNDQYPFDIPQKYDDLPRLLGRAEVLIKTTKGNMNAIIDGYNAPLTGGAFIDLVTKGFYDGLPFARAEDFYVLQTGDPKGPDIGYINPSNNEERHVPLEIKIPGKKETVYNQTFEDMGLFTETPVLPFATLGTLGWAHSNEALDDGSSQFFFFLYEAELNPAGRNLIDGRNAAFGYVVEGSEILNKLGVDDKIISIQIENGEENLKENGSTSNA